MTAVRGVVRGALVALLLLWSPGCFWYLERDPNELKPVVPAPAFALPSNAGPMVTLDELKQQGHVVLVFYRGHW